MKITLSDAEKTTLEGLRAEIKANLDKQELRQLEANREPIPEYVLNQKAPENLLELQTQLYGILGRAKPAVVNIIHEARIAFHKEMVLGMRPFFGSGPGIEAAIARRAEVTQFEKLYTRNWCTNFPDTRRCAGEMMEILNDLIEVRSTWEFKRN